MRRRLPRQGGASVFSLCDRQAGGRPDADCDTRQTGDGGFLRTSPSMTKFLPGQGYTIPVQGGMKMVIYLDIAFLLNALADALALYGTARLTGLPVQKLRLAAAAALGGTYGAVCALPGPCALVAALAVSGQPAGRFTFEGFLPMNKKNRKNHLDSLQNETRTMIFYEAPHKLPATLEDLAGAFGPDRPIALCRELSKLHEEIVRTTLGAAAAFYRENTPRGEFVLVVGGGPPAEEAAPTLEDGTRRVEELQGEGQSHRDAVRQAARELGLSRSELYDRTKG